MRKLIVLMGMFGLVLQVVAGTAQINTKQIDAAVEGSIVERILKENDILHAGQKLKDNYMLTRSIDKIYSIEKRANCNSITYPYYLHNADFSNSFYIAIKKSADGGYFYVYRNSRGGLEYMQSTPPVEVKCLDKDGNPKTEILYLRPIDNPFVMPK